MAKSTGSAGVGSDLVCQHNVKLSALPPSELNDIARFEGDVFALEQLFGRNADGSILAEDEDLRRVGRALEISSNKAARERQARLPLQYRVPHLAYESYFGSFHLALRQIGEGLLLAGGERGLGFGARFRFADASRAERRHNQEKYQDKRVG